MNIEEDAMGRKRQWRNWNHGPTVHIKGTEEERYTLCGRRIFYGTTNGIGILCASDNMNIQASTMCKICDKKRILTHETEYRPK